MRLQELADVFLALTDSIFFVAVPGTGFVDDALRHAMLDDFTLAGDALAVEDLELGHPEWWRHLVFDDFDARLVTDDLVAFLYRTDATNVESNRRIKLEGIAAGRRLRAAEHDADLHTNLVDENHHRVGTLDVGSQLAQRL